MTCFGTAPGAEPPGDVSGTSGARGDGFTDRAPPGGVGETVGNILARQVLVTRGGR